MMKHPSLVSFESIHLAEALAEKELRTVSSSEKFQKAHGMSWD